MPVIVALVATLILSLVLAGCTAPSPEEPLSAWDADWLKGVCRVRESEPPILRASGGTIPPRPRFTLPPGMTIEQVVEQDRQRIRELPLCSAPPGRD